MAVAVSGAVLPAATFLPPIVVIGSHAPQRRLSADGWFARGFSATSGVLIAQMLFMFIACAGLIALLIALSSVHVTRQ